MYFTCWFLLFALNTVNSNGLSFLLSESDGETIPIFLSQLDFECGLKSRALAYQEYLEHLLDLSRFDVDYSTKFEETYRGPTTDITLDTVESR